MKIASVAMMVFLGAAVQDPAAPPASSPTPRPPAESAIHQANAAFEKAFASGDAAGVAAMFTEDAEVVDETGDRVQGREAIAARFADLFRQSPGASLKITTETLRPLSPESMLEEGQATITPAKGASPETSRFEVIYVKQDGRWLQARVRDFAVQAATPHDRLLGLEWLVGDWIDESPDGVIKSSCAWSVDGNYLIRDFHVQSRGKQVATGTQCIGWDPSTAQIKSWTFDADGTHSEQLWAQDDQGRWIVKSSGTLADGRKATATNVLTRTGADRASWTSTDRTIGDTASPNLESYLLVRTPPSSR